MTYATQEVSLLWAKATLADAEAAPKFEYLDASFSDFEVIVCEGVRAFLSEML